MSQMIKLTRKDECVNNILDTLVKLPGVGPIVSPKNEDSDIVGYDGRVRIATEVAFHPNTTEITAPVTESLRKLFNAFAAGSNKWQISLNSIINADGTQTKMILTATLNANKLSEEDIVAELQYKNSVLKIEVN